MRSADNSRKFSALLSIKAYSPFTYQGILNELKFLPFEYNITQSFRFYDREDTKARMRNQQNELLQSKDESVSQTVQIDEVFDEAASG
jgi:type IV secretion system protein VirB4